MKIIWVRWLDSSSLGSEWRLAEDLDETGEPFMLESVGFLVKETKAGLYIATDFDPERPEDRRFRYNCFIPRAMIKKKRIFKVSE